MKKSLYTAGSFFPSQKEELENLLESYKIELPRYFSRAVIVPHAGYKFSGKLAAKGIQYLSPNTKNIFIFAPAHYERLFGCSVCSYESFKTPFGEVKVNQELSKNLAEFCDCHTYNYAFEKEHSIEVHLPMIKKYHPDAQIIPVLYGCENFKNLSQTIEKFFVDKNNSFIISTDLSHFYPEKEACKIDNYTAKMIEENNTKDFEIEQACGAVGICGISEFAKNNNFSLIRLGLTNSSLSNGDTSRVVGYGSWFLYEGEKNEYIKKYHSDFVLKICRESILSGFQLGATEIKNYACIFEQNAYTFVTISIDNKLRGCVGNIMPAMPLIKSLSKNAHAAAFSDKRFSPLTIEEFEKANIQISLLSKPERIIFDDETELLDKIIPNKDGLIIRNGLKCGVFLPDVWKLIPDKKKFLDALKEKTGFDTNDTFEAFKFSTTIISSCP